MSIEEALIVGEILGLLRSVERRAPAREDRPPAPVQVAAVM